MTDPSRDIAEANQRRLAWLEASAARCERLHPKADCHKRYRRNADDLREHLKQQGSSNG